MNWDGRTQFKYLIVYVILFVRYVFQWLAWFDEGNSHVLTPKMNILIKNWKKIG